MTWGVDRIDGVPPLPAIAKTAIIVGDLGKLGSDGMLYKALPDNASRDITPRVAGVNYYQFSVVPQKHQLTIVASDDTKNTPLDDYRVRSGATYSIGQKVRFTTVFVPVVPGLTIKDCVWSFSGNFVNAFTQWHQGGEGGYEEVGSRDYYVEPSVLDWEDTLAWWRAGAYSPQGKEEKAHAGLNLTFSNSQRQHISSDGRLSIFEPDIGFLPSPGAAVSLWGTAIATIGLRETQAMVFTANVFSDSRFPGTVFATQLVNADLWKIVDGVQLHLITTENEWYLDTYEKYPETETELTPLTSNPSVLAATSVFGDYPSVSSLPATYVFLSPNEDFRTYFLFKPTTLDSIPVTIGRVNWSWWGNAEYDDRGLGFATWMLISSDLNGPSFTKTHEPASWKHTITGW